MSTLHEVTNLLHEAMSVAESLDAEDLVSHVLQDALDTLAHHGHNIDASDLTVGGATIRAHIDTLVTAIDEAHAVALSIATELGV